MFVTNIAGAAGAIGAMLLSWILFKKPDASMSLNGALAGLVSITAGCDAITPLGSLFVGLIGGEIPMENASGESSIGEIGRAHV